MKLKYLSGLIIFAFMFNTGATVKVLDGSDLRGILPAYWLDHTGFSLPGDSAFNSFTIPESGTMAPLLPIYKSGFASKTYIGGIIEKKYIDGLNQTQLNSLVRKGMNIKTQEGYGHYAVKHEGNLYFIRDDYNLQRETNTTVGFSLSFGGSDKTVILGETKVFGMSMNFTNSISMTKESGFNYGKSFQDLFDQLNSLSNTDDSNFILQQAINIAPTLLNGIQSSKKKLSDENGNPLASVPTDYNGHSIREPKPDHKLTLQGDHTYEWMQTQKELKKNLNQEIQWRKDVAPIVKNEIVVVSVEQNKFIQDLCDRLATAYKVPTEIWPRCRIAGTAVPNAWAYPGGDIFFSAGLLGILSDVDSVANVLGHEIGHVMARHGSRSKVYQEAFYYGASALSLGANLGVATFSLTGGFGVLGKLTWLTWFPETMISSMASSYVVGKSLELAMFAPAAAMMKYSRENELQADRLGQEAAYQVGVNLSKMTNGWHEFANYFKEYAPVKSTFTERLMRSHPNEQKRIKRLEERQRVLESTLLQDNNANQITEELRADYQRILHLNFKPYAHAFGREMKSKILVSQKEGAKNKQALHLIHMLESGQTDCITSALGME